MRKTIPRLLAVALCALAFNVSARFVSVDPVQPNQNTGANFNRYYYANNNPYKFTDPDGRQNRLANWENKNIHKIEPPPRAEGDWLGPTIGVALTGVLAAPVAAEVGMAALANPGAVATATEIAAGAAGVTGTAGGLIRAKAVQAVLSPRTQRAVTTAVAETAEGVRVFGSSEGALRPAQRAALQAGELAAKGVRGTHAEVNAVNGARAQGLTPTSVSPSRLACPSCQQIMQDLDIPIIDR